MPGNTPDITLDFLINRAPIKALWYILPIIKESIIIISFYKFQDTIYSNLSDFNTEFKIGYNSAAEFDTKFNLERILHELKGFNKISFIDRQKC